MNIAEKKNKNAVTKKTIQQYELFLGTYKHHFELLVKAYILYVSILGFLAGYVFEKELSHMYKLMLSILLFVGTVFATYGCFTFIKFVFQIRVTIKEIERELNLKEFPLHPTMQIAYMFVGISLLFNCASLFHLVMFIKEDFRFSV